MTVRVAPAVLGALLALVSAAPASAQSDESAAALQRWVEAVRTHVPGKADAQARSVASMSYADRARLQPSMQAFLQSLHARPGRPRTKAQAVIFNLARPIREDAAVTSFLRRAAMLHTDAAVFREDVPAPPDEAPPPAQPPRPGPTRLLPTLQPHATPPLLSNERLLLHRDGQLVGEAGLEWNWPFARSLMDLLPATERAFAGEWYHAVAAYMMSIGDQTAARAHLEHAAGTLPDDPRVLFDRAAYAETVGLPYNQEVRYDREFESASRRAGLTLPLEGETNADAEALYRRTLAIDPGYVEARVRLARLLDHRGRHDEASAEITRALDAKASGVVGFYAHIVAGRIATARGRHDDALRQYREASGLFRHAQSARLGASQAAIMSADVTDALEQLADLDGTQADDESDPWWSYQLGAGRDADALMAALWKRVDRQR